MTTKETQHHPGTKATQPTEKRSALRLSQVLATVLAAVTAAFLGSRLGVAGTVTGAGVASLVSTLGTAIYQNSLDRTSRAARKVRSHVVARTGKRPLPPAAPTEVLDQPPTQITETTATTEVTGAWAPTRRFEPVRRPDAIADATTDWLSKPTELFSRPTEVKDRPTGVFQHPAEARTELVGPPTQQRRRLRWPVLVGATALAFVIGMGAVTGIELLAHRPLSGGNAGTTISGLFGGATQKPATPHPNTPARDTTSHEAPTTTPTPPSSDAPTSTPSTSVNPTPSTTTPPASTTTPPPSSAPTTTTGKQGAP
ncbi:MAG TPA: hypothetical protein VJ914_12825 [Pseudonocardiaceae bacterium]|nr:hypothetical protein [Pseudonocardiaceae bacterium]